MAATIKLETFCKEKLGQALKEEVTHGSLAYVNSSVVTDTALNDANLVGNKEKLQIKYQGVNHPVKTNNSLSNSPLLVFTIESGKKPTEYHFTKLSGGTYTKKMIITRTSPTAVSFDTALQLRDFEVSFKGSGEE